MFAVSRYMSVLSIHNDVNRFSTDGNEDKNAFCQYTWYEKYTNNTSIKNELKKSSSDEIVHTIDSANEDSCKIEWWVLFQVIRCFFFRIICWVLFKGWWFPWLVKLNNYPKYREQNEEHESKTIECSVKYGQYNKYHSDFDPCSKTFTVNLSFASWRRWGCFATLRKSIWHISSIQEKEGNVEFISEYCFRVLWPGYISTLEESIRNMCVNSITERKYLVVGKECYHRNPNIFEASVEQDRPQNREIR